MSQGNPHPNPQFQSQQPPPGQPQVNPQPPQPQQPQNPNTVYQGDSTLPPPGHQRDETLRQRADELDQKKSQYDDMALGIDPTKLEKDREIQYEIERGNLSIPYKNPEYKYCWVQCQYPVVNPNQKVEQKLTRSVKISHNGQTVRVPAWEIVTKDMAESKGLRLNALGHCQIGDTILMRCRQEVYRLIELKERERKLQIRRHTDAELVQKAMEHQRRGAKIGAGQDVYNKYLEDANEALASFDKLIRNGSVPGLDVNQST